MTVCDQLQVGGRPGYSTVARAVYQNMPSLVAARSRYPEVKAPVHLVHGEKDWSRPSDRPTDEELLPAADFAQVPGAGRFIALERPDGLAGLSQERRSHPRSGVVRYGDQVRPCA
ncbi:alpha/beta hydrolase [Streptomyces sp. WI04-05B]|nr:alpha/beta hydrolase [Streptomyces sp. WI04-05B]MDX2583310.1 alpha/beta hydrolase [Streptomyces sp. WI04-05A]MDX3745077.1 alpha/beta hydrolase [Streptomyces sp. AK08-02]